jgi:hypothetical protein
VRDWYVHFRVATPGYSHSASARMYKKQLNYNILYIKVLNLYIQVLIFLTWYLFCHGGSRGRSSASKSMCELIKVSQGPTGIYFTWYQSQPKRRTDSQPVRGYTWEYYRSAQPSSYQSSAELNQIKLLFRLCPIIYTLYSLHKKENKNNDEPNNSNNNGNKQAP